MSATSRPPETDPPWRRGAAVRALGAGLAAACYLGLLAIAALLAAAGAHYTFPLIVASAAGTMASAALLCANLAMRASPPAPAACRWLIGASGVLVAAGLAILVGLAFFHIAVNHVTEAALAFGAAVPLLGVAVPAVPTLAAAFRR